MLLLTDEDFPADVEEEEDPDNEVPRRAAETTESRAFEAPTAGTEDLEAARGPKKRGGRLWFMFPRPRLDPDIFRGGVLFAAEGWSSFPRGEGEGRATDEDDGDVVSADVGERLSKPSSRDLQEEEGEGSTDRGFS